MRVVMLFLIIFFNLQFLGEKKFMIKTILCFYRVKYALFNMIVIYGEKMFLLTLKDHRRSGKNRNNKR
jgi:hypothetical protein